MAANVLLRVMIPLVKAVRPELEVHDPWATGRAQHLLWQPARAEQEIDSQHAPHQQASGFQLSLPEQCRHSKLPTQPVPAPGARLKV